MKKYLRLIFVFLFLFPAFTWSQPKAYEPTWESLDTRPMPQWFQDAKFGIFIHWGAYSVPAWSPKGQYAEWYQYWQQSKAFNGAVTDYHAQKYGADYSYYKFADEFKAERFNPDEWADLFQKAGAKYMVLTSKHHDGFALWNSKEATKTWGFPWNAVETGAKRDLLGDLLAAMQKKGVRPGMYYSLYEWFNPLWKSDKDRYVREHMMPQMYDLINTYKPDIFWTDGDWDMPAEKWKSKEFLAWLYNESPVKNSVVVNDRWGEGVRFHHGGIFTPEYQPHLTFDRYFEESRGIGFSYGYNREEDASDYNSAQILVYQLCDLVSRGGNLLLDIGPDGHGKIPPIMQERLLEIGRWLSLNGEAIYGTRKWRQPMQWSEGNRNFQPKNHDWKTGGEIFLKQTVNPDPGFAVKEAFFTTKNGDLYAILPQWSKTFLLKDVILKPQTRITLLETNTPLKWVQQGEHVLITMPEFDPNVIKTSFAFALKIHQDGQFVQKPTVQVSYPKTDGVPLVTLSSETEGAVLHYTTDGSAPSKSSPIYTQPFTLPQTATVRVQAFAPNMVKSLEVLQDVLKHNFHAPKTVRNAQAGIQMKMVIGAFKSVNEVPTTGSTYTATHIALPSNATAENYGLVFDGYIKVPKTGIYTFFLESDDGSVLWVNEQKVVDHDGFHATEEKSGKIALQAGLHKLKVVYFQATGGKSLKLSYQMEGVAKSEVPPNMLWK